MNPLEDNFQRWRDRLRYYCDSKRGLYSRLAEHLGVHRNTAYRWVKHGWTSFPGWAAVATNVWYYERVPRAVDQALREEQKLGPIHFPKVCNRIRLQTPELVFPQENQAQCVQCESIRPHLPGCHGCRYNSPGQHPQEVE